MARKLDPTIGNVLKRYGFDQEACWDCHGTWVVYHWALERISAQAGIRFDMPVPLETNGKDKSVALCVAGTLSDKTEWSIGEASPSNNKNGYPYAMAEKRAKDRVILKLIGLHGIAYSDEEADAFKDQGREQSSSNRGGAAEPPAGQREGADSAGQSIEVIDADGQVTEFRRTNKGALAAMKFLETEIDNAQEINAQVAIWSANAKTFRDLAESKAGAFAEQEGAQTIKERVEACDTAFRKYMEAA